MTTEERLSDIVEILAHGLLWLDVLRDYHGSIRSHNFRRFLTEGGLISFGIDQAALYRLPATGKRVEMAVAVIVGFRNGKISHEHIYWDQASVLVQIGLLDPAGLPIGGAEVARKVVNPKLPSRRF